MNAFSLEIYKWYTYVSCALIFLQKRIVVRIKCSIDGETIAISRTHTLQEQAEKNFLIIHIKILLCFMQKIAMASIVITVVIDAIKKK